MVIIVLLNWGFVYVCVGDSWKGNVCLQLMPGVCMLRGESGTVNASGKRYMTCTVRHDDITYALALSLFFYSLSHVLAFLFFPSPGFAPSNQIHSFLALSLPSIPARLIIFFLSSVSLTVVIPSPSISSPSGFTTLKGEVTEYCVRVEIQDLHLNPQHYYTAIIISIVLKEALKLHCSLTKCKVSAWLTKRGLLPFHVFFFFWPGNYKTILTLWRIITSWKIRAAIGRPLEISGRGLGHVVSSLKWQIWDQMDSFYFLKQIKTIVDAVTCCSLRKQVLKDTLFSLA